MTTSLTSFCKQYRLPKTTVYELCRKLNISTQNGLDQAAIAQLKREFKIGFQPISNASEPSGSDSVVDAELVPDGFIQGGALATVETREIELPEGFDPGAMVRFFDGVTGQATDTGKLLAIADLALDAVSNAMDGKLAEQREQLQQAERDAKALAQKVSEVKGDLKVKALESRILAERQTAATKTAEQLFSELMTMGKPSDGASDC